MLKVSGVYDIETYLTVAIELKLDEATKLRWTEHSNKCETTPLCDELLEFLYVQATDHDQSISHNTRSVPKATPRTVYPAGSNNAYVACKKDTHPLNTCCKFQGMSCDERWALYSNRSGICMNFLRAGHNG